MPGPTPEPSLLERAAELSALDAALEGTSTDGAPLLVIEGPAGIGKTNRVSALCERALERGR